MSAPIDLMQERLRRRPPEAPPPDDLFAAAELIRDYALKLHMISLETHGAADIACANLCCFADCIEREAESLQAAQEEGK